MYPLIRIFEKLAFAQPYSDIPGLLLVHIIKPMTIPKEAKPWDPRSSVKGFKSIQLTKLFLWQVYESAVRWLDYDLENRRPYRYKVLSCIKFPHINQSYLMDHVIKSGHLSDDKRGKEILDEAVLYHTVPSRRHMLPSYQVGDNLGFCCWWWLILKSTSFFPYGCPGEQRD